MRRSRRFSLLLAVVAGWVAILIAHVPRHVFAQDATPEPAPPNVLVPDVLMPTAAPTVTPAPVSEALPVLTAARADLELLANTALGTTRPVGWSGSLNTADPQLAVLIRLDLELLAATLLAVESRPGGWFGAVSSTPVAIARDIRHDLELLADGVVEPGIRPPGWIGSDPLMRCSRAVQSLVALLERQGYLLRADPNGFDFCAVAELEVSLHVEQVALTQPLVAGPEAPAVPTLAGPVAGIRPSTTGAAVFRDRNARERAGVLPRGVSFTPIARSTTPFSNMMVVRGDGFEVFIDYTFTTLDLAEFEALPPLETVPLAIQCAAPWCG